jgi:adenylyltransferase/sulfurtransferase
MKTNEYSSKHSKYQALNTAGARRYARHLVMPEIGEVGQAKLAASKLVVVGAGGLGASCLMALAASGVGTIAIIEPDHVELSNLPRQTLYETADIGSPKAKAAKARLEEINPDIAIINHQTRLGEDNAGELLAGYDLVIDGTDNFASRFAINDACMRAKTPWIFGAMIGFLGQLALFCPHENDANPCYRCLVPEVPEREISCAQAGIISPLAGIIGSMQALMALNFLLGIDKTQTGKLLRFDAKKLVWRESKLPRDPACHHG